MQPSREWILSRGHAGGRTVGVWDSVHVARLYVLVRYIMSNIRTNVATGLKMKSSRRAADRACDRTGVAICRLGIPTTYIVHERES